MGRYCGLCSKKISGEYAYGYLDFDGDHRGLLACDQAEGPLTKDDARYGDVFFYRVFDGEYERSSKREWYIECEWDRELQIQEGLCFACVLDTEDFDDAGNPSQSFLDKVGELYTIERVHLYVVLGNDVVSVGFARWMQEDYDEEDEYDDEEFIYAFTTEKKQQQLLAFAGVWETITNTKMEKSIWSFMVNVPPTP